MKERHLNSCSVLPAGAGEVRHESGDARIRFLSLPFFPRSSTQEALEEQPAVILIIITRQSLILLFPLPLVA